MYLFNSFYLSTQVEELGHDLKRLQSEGSAVRNMACTHPGSQQSYNAVDVRAQALEKELLHVTAQYSRALEALAHEQEQQTARERELQHVLDCQEEERLADQRRKSAAQQLQDAANASLIAELQAQIGSLTSATTPANPHPTQHHATLHHTMRHEQLDVSSLLSASMVVLANASSPALCRKWAPMAAHGGKGTADVAGGQADEVSAEAGVKEERSMPLLTALHVAQAPCDMLLDAHHHQVG